MPECFPYRARSRNLKSFWRRADRKGSCERYSLHPYNRSHGQLNNLHRNLHINMTKLGRETNYQFKMPDSEVAGTFLGKRWSSAGSKLVCELAEAVCLTPGVTSTAVSASRGMPSAADSIRVLSNHALQQFAHGTTFDRTDNEF